MMLRRHCVEVRSLLTSTALVRNRFVFYHTIRRTLTNHNRVVYDERGLVQRQFYHGNSGSENVSTTARYGRVISAVVAGVIGGVALWEYHHHGNTADVNCKDKISEKKEIHQVSLQEAISRSEELLQRIKMEKNCPGLVVAVNVDGQNIWSKGYGFADIENLVECRPDTVMRIASISKPLTMVALARLWEQGKLDLDANVQRYVPTWPDKTFGQQKVSITTRQLVSMKAGIRHYDKTCEMHRQKKKDEEKEKKTKERQRKTRNAESNELVKKANKDKKKCEKLRRSEFEHREYHIKKHYNTVTESLQLFKDDPLCSLPGTEYLYSTHAWILASAVVEGASERKFPDVMKELFTDLGMDNTYLDENQPVIPNRARYYVYDKKRHQLLNAAYVDNSYKWAGGGFLSTVLDLCHFADSMLYSSQALPGGASDPVASGYLRPDTVAMLWTPMDKVDYYGMGWVVKVPGGTEPAVARDQHWHVTHSGGAVGASSILLILPRREQPALPTANTTRPPDSTTPTLPGGTANLSRATDLPRGVTVAIIVNTQSVGLSNTALKIAKLFERVDFS